MRRSRWKQWRHLRWRLAAMKALVFALALMEVRCVCVGVFVGANDSRYLGRETREEIISKSGDQKKIIRMTNQGVKVSISVSNA